MSDLPSVPFAVPVPGLSFEEYLQYQMWRIDIQMVATAVWTWKHALSGGEKADARKHILNNLADANKRAQGFPCQPLPDDIREPHEDRPFIRIPELLADLAEVFA
jgi:hypothetical protein